ncbi:hypothetical protein DL93DRAFT_2126087 [Clavulina sp. PMI_390]|nr:hypothetical protein DL93DRAFT_2126087 [Clavulina sp. PMI_390]
MIFTALSGDAASPHPRPLAYVLQIDDIKVLLDCGSPEWCPETPEDYDWSSYCNALESIAPSIDLVLFSHGDLPHLGLYAYAHARWGLTAPVYASLPVQALGRIAVNEEAENIRASQDVDSTPQQDQDQQQPKPEVEGEAEGSTSTDVVMAGSEEKKARGPLSPLIATSAEIASAFDGITTLRYSQPTHLSGKCQGLTITAYGAGHTLGGTLWKIRSASSGTILYAVHMNHMKERHLEGTALVKRGAGAAGGNAIFEPLARPDLFITDAERTLMVVPRRRDRDAALLENITTVLEDKRKSVLMPCDTSARLLEILLMVDQHWQFARLRWPICLVSRTGKEMVNLVRSLVEWMGGSASLEDDETGTATLKFRHLEYFTSPAALLAEYPKSKPKLVLVVPASLSHGPSRELFAEFAKMSGNLVMLTARGEPGSLSRMLYDRWRLASGLDGTAGEGASVGAPVNLRGEVLSLSMHSKVPLEGAELEEHLEQERLAKEREAAAQGALARSQRLLEADEGGDDESSDGSGSDDDDDDEREVDDAMKIDEPGMGGMDWSMLDTAEDSQSRAQQVSYDIYLRGNTVARTATSFFKTGTAGGLTRYRMFPMVERRRRVDAYGEILDVGAWMRKGKALEEEAKGAHPTMDVIRLGGEVEAPAPEVEPPSKFVATEVEVPLNCQVFYVDMEGLNDGRAIKTIVPQVNPRKMIIVHASEEATASLVASCASIRTMTKEIFHPHTGEQLVVGQQSNTYSILLSDEVFENVHLSRFEDNQVGHIHGRISIGPDSSIPTLEAATTFAFANISNNANHLSSASSSSAPPPNSKMLAPRAPSSLPQSTIIGDLKLTILKARLATLGVNAEFAGEGTLVCSAPSSGADVKVQPVAVKKTGRGQVVLEGAPSQIYYLVRQEVYGLHAVVMS